MMSIARRLLSWLKSDRGVQRQLQWYLFVLRVYLPTKRQFEVQYDGQHTTKSSRDETSFSFPEYPRLFRVYNIVGNIFLSWVFLKCSFPGFYNQFHRQLYYGTLNRLDSLDLEENIECFSFGRLVIHYELSDEFLGWLLAAYHLFWRLIEAALNRPFSLDVVLFLMQPKELVERFISKLKTRNLLIGRMRRLRRTRPLLDDHYHHHHHWHRHIDDDDWTERERLLCRIMCYRLTFGVELAKGRQEGENSRVFDELEAKIVYRLRPNRTLEEREKLIGTLANTTITAAAGFMLLFVSFASYITVVVFFNQHRYAKQFANCDRQFANLLAEGAVEHWSWPAPVSSHRLAAIVADGVENGAVWLECGLVLLGALFFVNYLNGDLLCYWRHLDTKLSWLSRESKKIHMIYFEDKKLEEKIQLMSMNGMLCEFQEQIYALHTEMGDFCRQIQQVDLLVSDVITHALLIWLSAFGYLSYKSADLWTNQHNGEFASVCIVFAMAVFLGYSVASVALLTLQRRCRSSYLALCSAMAYDQSIHKARFSQLILCYTNANRTCYTLFHQWPFSSSNFLSFIGWSLTGFLILDNVYHRH